jgi:hypothetical protein
MYFFSEFGNLVNVWPEGTARGIRILKQTVLIYIKT